MSDIHTLFATDPLELTDKDIDAIIEVQRKQRVAFKAGVSTRTTKVSQTASKVADALNLDDLGL